jgi:phosphatidylglycerophosphatase A
MRFAVRLLATGLFTGCVGKGSGTAASLLSCVLWAALSAGRAYPWTVLCVAVVGFPVAHYADARIFPEQDSPKIVIDEIAGMLVTMLGFSFTVPADLLYLGGGFVLFRALDILKPFPLGRLQRIGGGSGIMLDDLAAGAAANLVLRAVRWLVL